MTPRLRHIRAPGFTLVEVAVALLLLSMVLTFVYESFVMSIRTKAQVENIAESYQSARIAMQRMEREIQSAYLEHTKRRFAPSPRPPTPIPSPNPNPNQAVDEEAVDPDRRTTAFVGKSGEGDGYPHDQLDFTTLSHYAMSAAGEDDRQSDHEEVAYFVETDYKEQRTDLMHRSDFTLDDDPLGGGDIYPLIEGIRGLNFRYLDPYRKSWEDNWDSADGRGLPAAVEVMLWIDNPSDEKNPLLFTKVVRVPLYAPTMLKDVQLGQQGQQEGGSPYGQVVKDRQGQLEDVFGVSRATPDNPRLNVNTGRRRGR